MKVKLEDVVDAIEMASDEYQYFYNRMTGEVLAVGDPFLTGDEQDREMLEEIDENWDNYERLPAKYDINEYQIMESFIEDEIPAAIQDQMEEAIRGKGAFRRFKEMLRGLDMEEEWYGYRDMEYRRLAKEWCGHLGITWE